MTKSEILDFGFKKKQKNKKVFFRNEALNLTLENIEGTEYYTLLETGEKIEWYTELWQLIATIEIRQNGEQYKAGLPTQNLAQGNFETAFFEYNNGEDNHFMSFENAKKLLEAQFRWYLCRALMGSSSGPNWDYRIVKTYFTFRTLLDSKNQKYGEELTLHYDYEDHGYAGHHKFDHSVGIYSFHSPDKNFPINSRVGVYVPYKLLIENFL